MSCTGHAVPTCSSAGCRCPVLRANPTSAPCDAACCEGLGGHEGAVLDSSPSGVSTAPHGPGRRRGWIANTTGSELLLRVDTRSGGSYQVKGQQNEIILSFLHSYQNMGKASVECMANCE